MTDQFAEATRDAEHAEDAERGWYDEIRDPGPGFVLVGTPYSTPGCDECEFKSQPREVCDFTSPPRVACEGCSTPWNVHDCGDDRCPLAGSAVFLWPVGAVDG